MLSIRRATENDAAAVADLAERTFRDTFAAVNTAQDLEMHCRKSYAESIQAAEIRDPTRTTLLCHADDRLIAYGQLRWNNPPPGVVGARPAEIQRFYVDAPWHGKGVAGPMMTSLLQAAISAGADVAWLGVWEGNPRAIAFYEKSGFSVVGEHTFIVGTDRQRDLVLAKPLGVA